MKRSWSQEISRLRVLNWIRYLGKPSRKKSAGFLTIVQKAFAPPPLPIEHYMVNFSEGILTIVDKITHKSMVKMSNLD